MGLADLFEGIQLASKAFKLLKNTSFQTRLLLGVCVILAAALAFSYLSWPTDVRGKVLALGGNPIPKGEVCIEKTDQCAETDRNGNFQIRKAVAENPMNPFRSMTNLSLIFRHGGESEKSYLIISSRDRLYLEIILLGKGK